MLPDNSIKQIPKSATFSYRNNEDEGDDDRFCYTGEGPRVSGAPLYPHNTYHGPGIGYNQHQRTPLAQANFRPLVFTDNYSSQRPTASASNPPAQQNGEDDILQNDQVRFSMS